MDDEPARDKATPAPEADNRGARKKKSRRQRKHSSSSTPSRSSTPRLLQSSVSAKEAEPQGHTSSHHSPHEPVSDAAPSPEPNIPILGQTPAGNVKHHTGKHHEDEYRVFEAEIPSPAEVPSPAAVTPPAGWLQQHCAAESAGAAFEVPSAPEKADSTREPSSKSSPALLKAATRPSGRSSVQSASPSRTTSSTERRQGTGEQTPLASLPSQSRSLDTSVTVTPGATSLSEKPTGREEAGSRGIGQQEEAEAPLTKDAPQGQRTSSETTVEPLHPGKDHPQLAVQPAERSPSEAGPIAVAGTVLPPRAASPLPGKKSRKDTAKSSTRSSRLYNLEKLMEARATLPKQVKNIMLDHVVGTIAVAGAFFLVVLIGILALRAFIAIRAPEICHTDDCAGHVTLLTRYLNTSIDPCYDFDAYVCSAWKPASDSYLLGTSVMNDVLYRWFQNFNRTLYGGTKKLHVGAKPLVMFSACMSPNTKVYGVGFQSFRRVMHDLGLRFPEDPQPGTNVLNLLVHLAFHWEVVSLFRARVLDASASAGRRIVLVQEPFVPLLLKQHLEVMPLDKYYDYWATFFEYLVTDKTFERPNKSAVSDLAVMERDILENLTNASSLPSQQPRLLAIHRIRTLIWKFSPSEWLNALNTNTAGKFNFTLDVELLVTDKNYFERVDAILRRYEDVELLRYISWQFVQEFAVVADKDLFVLRYGGRKDAEFFRQLFCAYIAETPYQQLVSSLVFASRFSERDVNLVNAKFKNLIDETGKKLAALDWLDESSKNLTLYKLSSVQLRLWPPQRYLVSEELDRAYVNFTSREPSLAEYWAKTRRSLINAKFSSVFPDVSNQAPNYQPPYFKYDATINSVKVPIAALTWPLYYRDGTEAMFYGGLGYSLALQIMHSIGQQGQKWHPNGSIVDTFLSHASSQAFQDRDKCLGSRSLFPDIPAIEVAYSALASSYTRDHNPKRIRADLSEDQVFFMTLCYISCNVASVVNSNFSVCNEVMQNFPNFAKAFDCPAGSKMSPRKQCTFFS